jgi:UDP-N-acetylglucosamine 2-epimerase
MIVTVIGARPQFVKAAVVSRALQKKGIQEIIVHTGQHYDEQMSEIFWKQLNIPNVSTNLQAGSGSHGKQTSAMIEKLEQFIHSLPEFPKALLLYGDTNSTLAGSIVASKINLPVIHVEAGLRSFNRTMPEEINRIVTDHLSGILFCSSQEGVTQLSKEGITNHVYNTGDVMYDAVSVFGDIADSSVSVNNILPFSSKEFVLLTLHRPSNTDNQENLTAIFNAIEQLKVPVLWPLHPRLKSIIENRSLPKNIYLIPPLGYLEMLTVLKNCSKVVTDSGGLQKEAYWLKKPCITVRTETEWVETKHNNWNQVVGVNTDLIVKAFFLSVEESTWKPLYGNADAADKIAEIIKQNYYEGDR